MCNDIDPLYMAAYGSTYYNPNPVHPSGYTNLPTGKAVVGTKVSNSRPANEYVIYSPKTDQDFC